MTDYLSVDDVLAAAQAHLGHPADHALIDGNKRTAFVSTALFYELNGHHISVETEDDLFDLVIAVATRKLDTVPAIARRLALFVE